MGDNFTRVGSWPPALIGVVGALSCTVDLVAAALGTKRAGASRRALEGTGLGTLLGIPFAFRVR